jgi:cyclomaltodextrinase
MWAEQSVCYQIYPLGFCGAPTENDGIQHPRIRKILDWIPHLEKLGCNGVYFGPVWESDRHGYDTRDFQKVDCRLGEEKDLQAVCQTLHAKGIRVILDGVFNHVGRGFWAFADLQQKKWDSPYKDWFYLHFDGNSPYNDGFWYEGWEGHFELVKLNLQNPQVRDYLFSCMKDWIKTYDIDGLRLDVAYCLDREFIRELAAFCRAQKPDFFLVGEMLHGDYNQLLQPGLLDSVTNYECYKGLYSSFNTQNFFEICYSLNRQFGPENWTLYRGKHLWSFVDNHDVTRIASILENPNHLPLIYGLLFAMPGIPCIYYGSEWGALGRKEEGDDALRQSYPQPVENALSAFVGKLSKLHQQEKALWNGSYQNVVLTNRQCVFLRQWEGEKIYIAINLDDQPYWAGFGGEQSVLELISGEEQTLHSGAELPPDSVRYWKVQ